jgi:hypothetical protein
MYFNPLKENGSLSVSNNFWMVLLKYFGKRLTTSVASMLRGLSTK